MIARADLAGRSEMAELIRMDLAAFYATLTRGAETIRAAVRGLESHLTRGIVGIARWHRVIGMWSTGDVDGALVELVDVPEAGSATPDDADALSIRSSTRLAAGDLDGVLSDLNRAIGFGNSARRSVALNRNYVQRQHRPVLSERLGRHCGRCVERLYSSRRGRHSVDSPTAHGVVQIPAGRGQWEVTSEHLSLAAAFQINRRRTNHGRDRRAMFMASAREDWDGVLREAAPRMESLVEGTPTTNRTPRWL